MRSLLRAPFAADLSVVFVSVRENDLLFLRPEHRQAMSLEGSSMRELAEQNLAAEFPELKTEEIAGGVFTLSPLSDFNSGRLLLSSQWKELESKVGAPLLACVPSRDSVFLANARAANVLRKACAIEHRASGYPIAPGILELSGAGWRAWEQ
ncbi:MAG: hypothetical protein HY901_35635 [Deltaproteobacteria bacterium]|nr:hypothetical protein [Deltaproteobacteria bacterium]